MLLRIANLLLLALTLCVGSAVAQGGPPGGSVNALYVAPSQPGLLYAATNIGIYRSDNGGVSWSDISGALPLLPVSSVAGTTEQLFVGVIGAGVYRSREGGDWQAVNAGFGDLNVLSLANDPNNPQILYGGTLNLGVFLSNNNGDGWIRTGVGGPNAADLAQGTYTDIRFAPGSSTHIFAVNALGAVFETLDSGQSWEPKAISQGLTYRRLHFDPSDPDIVYLGTTGGLVRRPGAGQPFTLVASFGANAVNSVLVDPADTNYIYAASDELGLARSTDGGQTWSLGGLGLPRATIQRLMAVPGTTTLLAGLDGTGVFASIDRATSWALSSLGLNSAEALSIATDPQNADVVYASTNGGGLFKSVDGGMTWGESRNGLFQVQPGRLAIDPANPQRIFSGSVNPFNTASGSLMRSLDGGNSWAAVLIQTPIYEVAAHPTDGQTVWAGTSVGFFGNAPPVLLSRNGGDSFSGLFGDDGILAGTNGRRIAIDPLNPRNVYVAGDMPFDFFGQGWPIFYSDDEGIEFRVDQFFPPVGALKVEPATGRIFAGFSLTQFSNGTIARSDDGGKTFNLKAQGISTEESNSINSFAFDPTDNAIYVSTGGSIYKSVNGGESWARAAAGLEGLGIRQLAVDHQRNGVVYAATFDTGVYKTVDGGASWQPAGGGLVLITKRGVTGAADFSGGGVAPGEIITIFGLSIGPTEGVIPGLDPETGKLPTEVAGVQVFFNGVPAPLFFVRGDQINCQVPYEMAGEVRVELRVEVNGVSSPRLAIEIVDARPAFFGNGVLNQDFSLNTASNPAPAGAFVQIFANGQGVVEPAVMTGLPGPAMEPFPRPKLPVEVRINGIVSEVFFAGMAPNFVGLLQINVRIPPGTPPGAVEVTLRIGERVSQTSGIIYVAP